MEGGWAGLLLQGRAALGRLRPARCRTVGLERFQQGFVVDQPASGGVDEHRVRLQEGESAGCAPARYGPCQPLTDRREPHRGARRWMVPRPSGLPGGRVSRSRNEGIDHVRIFRYLCVGGK